MVTHEIWARLILFNFCSYITGQVEFEKKKQKHIHQVNFSIAFKACRHFLRLHLGEKPPDVEGLTKKHTLYIPILTDRIILPHGRHFAYLLICHAVIGKHSSSDGMIHTICFKIYFQITLYSYIQTVYLFFKALN